jgi:hypothetical protein
MPLRSFVVALPPLLALVAYWPVLGLGYVWDDPVLYLQVPALRDFSSFWAGTIGSVVPGMHFFRPVAMLTFKLQFALLGDGAPAAHAINLVLHGVNTLLVATLAARVLRDRADAGPHWRALAAGLLYGLHPALIEPVSWMSCRFDLLVTLWLLLALHADLALRGRAARAAVVAALFFLALNSKEMSAPFPAVLVLFQLATRYRDVAWRELPRRALAGEGATYVLLVLVMALYGVLRASYVGGGVDLDPDIAERLTGLPERAAFVAATVLFHLRNAIAPFGALSPLHPVDLEALAFTPRDGVTLLAAGAVVAALALGTWRRVPAIVLLAAALLALVPVLNFVPVSIGRNIGHERYLTFPLTLAALALATAPFPGRAAPHFRTATAAAAALALGWLGAAVAEIRSTVPLWRSDVTLWSLARDRQPQSDYAHNSLVRALLNDGRPDLAATLITEPVPGSAFRASTQLHLALYLLDRGNLAAGEDHLRRALQGFPPWHAQAPRSGEDARDFDAFRGPLSGGYARLAEIELRRGRYAEAREAARIAEYYLPQDAEAVMVYALALYGLDQADEAAPLARRALELAAEGDRARLARFRDTFLENLCADAGARRARPACRPEQRAP